jgi:branched-chain amino acid transport system permease protein
VTTDTEGPPTPATEEAPAPATDDVPALAAAEALPRSARSRWLLLGVHAAVLVVLAAAPYFIQPGPLATLGKILVYALLAASLDLLVGTTGLPSLAHAAYFAVGAYTAGLVAINVTTNGPAQYGLALVAGGVAAALTGWLVVRSRGIYFLMLTLAVGAIIFQLAETWDDVTGGSNGLFGIPAVRVLPGGEPVIDAAPVYWYLLAGFVVGYLILWLVVASPFGRALRGIRDNEARMASLGYATFWYKYAAYCVAGAVAGAAGSLLAADERLVDPFDAGFATAVLALLAVVIGGPGSLWGPCVGAAVVIIVRDTLGANLGGHGPLLLGLVFIAVVYLLPRGVAGLSWRRLRPRRAGS